MMTIEQKMKEMAWGSMFRIFKTGEIQLTAGQFATGEYFIERLENGRHSSLRKISELEMRATLMGVK